MTDTNPEPAAPPTVSVPAPGRGDAEQARPRASQRKRSPLLWITPAVVVVVGLSAGLVVWAPWIPPPVLRPAGLVAGPITANSIAFHWSRPPTGPPPDKYLILSGGTVAGSAAGTSTSYRQAGLAPATTYQYRVVAVRGGKRSPQSALLTVSTLTPPISQARLQGTWSVYVKNIRGTRGSGTLSWQFSPTCAVGPCAVILHSLGGKYQFSMKLIRSGAAYTGHTVANFGGCGSGANSIPDPATLRIRIHLTKAAGQSQVWAATSWAGTVVVTYQYVSTAAFYCPAATFKDSVIDIPLCGA